MKKLYFFLLTAMFATMGLAQVTPSSTQDNRNSVKSSSPEQKMNRERNVRTINHSSGSGISRASAPSRATGTIIFSENFETSTAISLPAGWTLENNSGGEGWHPYAEAGYPPSGILCMSSDDISVARDEWAFTPGFNLTAGTTYVISFRLNMPGYEIDDYDSFGLKIGTSASSAGMNSTYLFSIIDAPSDTWELVEVTFVPTATGTYYLGFHVFSPFLTGDYVDIDDILVTEASCENYCEYRIEAWDSYGDGWDGGGKIVVTSGGSIIAEYRLASGSSGTGTFQICPNLPITFEWVSGTNLNENSFKIYDPNDELISQVTTGNLNSSYSFSTTSCPVLECPRPLISKITPLSNGAEITFLEYGSANSWQYAFSTNSAANPNMLNIVDISTTSFTIEDLEQSTQYYIWVRSVCDSEEYSLWRANNFRTLSPMVTVPYRQDFSNPAPEFVFRQNTIDAFAIGSATGNAAPALYISSNGGTTNAYTTNNAWAVAEVVIDFGNFDSYTLSFDWKCVGEGTTTHYDYGRVYLMNLTDNITSNSLPNGHLKNMNFIGQNTWQNFKAVLPGSVFANTVKKLVFVWRTDGSQI